jgi:hypothetical protein
MLISKMGWRMMILDKFKLDDKELLLPELLEE